MASTGAAIPAEDDKTASTMRAAIPAEDDKTVQPEAVESDQELQLRVDEKKLLRKLDLYIIPLVMALYLFSFLDRYVSSLLQLTFQGADSSESTLATPGSTDSSRTSTSRPSSSRSPCPSSSSHTSSSRCPPTSC